MKFLSVRDLRSKSAEAWKTLASEHELVLTSNGRPIAVLSSVDEDSLEETLAILRRSRALSAVSELQKRSAETGKDSLSLEEIEAEIAGSRRRDGMLGVPSE